MMDCLSSHIGVVEVQLYIYVVLQFGLVISGIGALTTCLSRTCQLAVQSKCDPFTNLVTDFSVSTLCL